MTRRIRRPARPRAVLFDLDDTLYRFAPCHDRALDGAHRVLGGPLGISRTELHGRYDRIRDTTLDELGTIASAHSREIFFKRLVEESLGRTAASLAMQANAAYWEGFHAPMEPAEGVPELLERLGSAGVALAVITNMSVGIQLAKLARLGLADRFDWVITSEEAGADKPDPRPFRLALARLGLTAAEALMVGDDLHRDIEGAAGVGLPSVWLRWGRPAPRLPAGAEQVEHPRDLAPLLLG